MDLRSPGVTQNAYFSLIACTKKLLLMPFCDTLQELEVQQDGTTTSEGQTEMNVEIAI